MIDSTQPSDDPRLDYKGLNTTKTAVDAAYFNMPGGAQIVIVDSTSGDPLEGGMLLDSGGTGNAAIAIEPDTRAGQYYLAAQDATGDEIAQSVQFYISDD